LAKRSHLYNFHKRFGNLIEFAGYDLPIWFKGIREEHMAVREAAGLFDISHMGRFMIEGVDTSRFLDYMIPSNLEKIAVGRAFYSVLCNESGGIVDDLVTLKFDEQHYIMVVNAANIEKDFLWLKRFSKNFQVEVKDASKSIALLSLQGPKAQKIIERQFEGDLSNVRRFSHIRGRLGDIEVILSRTGYTGEDGFEVFVLNSPLQDPVKAEKIWNLLLSSGSQEGILPCGLGARDTLRLEAGMCLYGHDIDETITPLEARLSWLIYFDKGDFVGKMSLMKQKEDGVKRVRTGFMMKSGGIPRAGYEIAVDGRIIGRVTNGTYSPLLKVGIAMGYVEKDFAAPGGEVKIMIRGSPMDAFIKTPPFYDESRYGWKRKVG